MTKSFLQRASSLPLSRLMSIAKDRYFSLPYSAGLFLHRPFRSTQQDSQAGISGNIRRESVPFLWVCIMGLADFIPDPDPLLQCALRLDVVNDVLCTPSAWILSEINAWQRYVLEFSIWMAEVFNVHVSTKLHRLMRHVDHHLIHLGASVVGHPRRMRWHIRSSRFSTLTRISISRRLLLSCLQHGLKTNSPLTMMSKQTLTLSRLPIPHYYLCMHPQDGLLLLRSHFVGQPAIRILFSSVCYISYHAYADSRHQHLASS